MYTYTYMNTYIRIYAGAILFGEQTDEKVTMQQDIFARLRRAPTQLMLEAFFLYCSVEAEEMCVRAG